jgi:hypothetical protein
MMASKSLLCVALVVMIATTKASVSTSKLQITLPQQLRKEEGYDHKEAMFGMPPYGGSIEQNLYYAKADLCDSNIDYSRGGYPSRPKDPEASGKMLQWKAPFILVVDRGGCTFVKKVRNAQKLGAAAVVIADTTCLCSAGDTCQSETFCEEKEPIMSDDGSGADVTIPSYLMYKQDADPIKNMLMQNKAVRMKMSWALPRPDDRVEYSLWTTPGEKISAPFLDEFQHAASALGEHAQFTPHMYLYDGSDVGCESDSTDDWYAGDPCLNLCTNKGRYCATDPDGDLGAGISGADVVKESLRRKCIWREYGQDGIGLPWWKYVNEFSYWCDNQYEFMDDECAGGCMERSGINPTQVKRCMDSSGGLEKDQTNSILEEELDSLEQDGVVVLPSVFVNNAPLRGGLTTNEVFQAICSGYAAGSEPSICKTCKSCDNVETCVMVGHCRGAPGSGDAVSFSFFATSMIGIIVCFSILGFVQWKRQQAQMHSEVRGIMAEYMPIDPSQTIKTVGDFGDDNDGDDDDENAK